MLAKWDLELGHSGSIISCKIVFLMVTIVVLVGLKSTPVESLKLLLPNL